MVRISCIEDNFLHLQLVLYVNFQQKTRHSITQDWKKIGSECFPKLPSLYSLCNEVWNIVKEKYFEGDREESESLLKKKYFEGDREK